MEWSLGAQAGMKQINTGKSGCPLLKLTFDEVLDLAFSGRAFGTLKNLDGTRTLVEIVDESKELRNLAPVWRKKGVLRKL